MNIFFISFYTVLYFLDVFPDFNGIYPLSITVHKETKAKAFSIE